MIVMMLNKRACRNIFPPARWSRDGRGELLDILLAMLLFLLLLLQRLLLLVMASVTVGRHHQSPFTMTEWRTADARKELATTPAFACFDLSTSKSRFWTLNHGVNPL